MIFAVCDVSVDVVARAISLSNHGSNITQLLRTISLSSLYENGIKVDDEDQLLILSTCMGDSNMRRIIVARRFREGENAETLKLQINKNRKK